MPVMAYPDELRNSTWERKKVTLDEAQDLQELLKKLEKRHHAAPWDKVGDDWLEAVEYRNDVQKAFEAVDRTYRAKVLALKFEATAVAAAADKAGSARAAPQLLRDATSKIERAARAYAIKVADGLDRLELQCKQALKELPDRDDEEEPSSVLINPKTLLKQLKLCKADPTRRVHFAMLDDGKKDPALVLHARLTGRALLAKLSKDLDIKTGAYGEASMAGANLQLSVEKKVSGLFKRVRIPIRDCGFRLGKVELMDDAGSELL